MLLNIIGMGLILTAIGALKSHSTSDVNYTTKPYREDVEQQTEINNKEEKIDFTSLESWEKELSSWNDYEILDKIRRMGASHYGFTISEARRYIAKQESLNKSNSLYGKCR